MRLLGLLSFLLLLGSCKTTNLFVMNRKEKKIATVTLDSAFHRNPNYEYRIRKNDKLNISVWGQDELSVGSIYGVYNSNEIYGKWLLVDEYGMISLPKIGPKQVLNYTLPQLKDTLKTYLSTWIVNPIIEVKVLNKEITILGEVKLPQTMVVDKDRNNLLDIVSRAGGFEFYADIRYIKVMRPSGDSTLIEHIDLKRNGKLSEQNIELHPGDVVVVPSKPFKDFDKRVSTIIPLASSISAFVVLLKLFTQ